MYVPNKYLSHYKCDLLLHLKIETIYLISLLLFTFQLLLNLSQNLDYAFLMMYAQWRGVYYVQLEDDILTKVCTTLVKMNVIFTAWLPFDPFPILKF